MYDSPISTSTLILDSSSSISYTTQVIGPPTFTPALYISGGICDVLQCNSSGPLPDLPAGSYCVTVTASAFDAMGSCGCFALLMDAAAPNMIFADGFELPAGR
jgi:hypothetical protein